jgi:hypothetical protein
MKVGIFLTNQHPLGSDMVSAQEDQYLMARLARDQGGTPSARPALSQQDGQLQLIRSGAAGGGSGTRRAWRASCSWPCGRSVAESMASLDVIWRSNFVFGVGLNIATWSSTPSGRDARAPLEQNLDIVKRLWTEDKVTVDAMSAVSDVTLTWPVCALIPIWIAANVDEAVRRAAPGRRLVRQPARRHGRSRWNLSRRAGARGQPGTGAARDQGDPARATRTALETRPALANKYRTYAAWGQAPYASDETFRQPSRPCCATGSSTGAEGASSCAELGGAGGDRPLLSHALGGMPLAASLASMRLISDELLPALRAVKTAGSPGRPPDPGGLIVPAPDPGMDGAVAVEDERRHAGAAGHPRNREERRPPRPRTSRPGRSDQ